MVNVKIRTQGLTWQAVGDDLIVLDLDGSVYLKLNGTARLLWERLSEGSDQSQLVDALVDDYDIEQDVAAADVAAFLDDLRARALLESD